MFKCAKTKDAFIGLSLLAVLVLVIFISTPAHAQVTGATMSGTVTDPSGAVIPNAQVVIKNTATGVTRNAKTDSSGLYTAPNLLPGPYSVTVSAPGFSTRIQRGITLTVGGQQVLNMSLQVGKVTNLVQVTGAAPTVQLNSSVISNVVNSTTVRALPLNGRSWTDLALLSPGVNNVTALVPFNAGSARGNRGYGGQATIGGVRPQFNNYRIDGISIMDYSNGSPGSVIGGNLGVDAIQEFSVLTTNYSAEYGRTAGGVVNAITRSGTNAFHGSVYEFLRNDALDAAGFFDNYSNAKKLPFRRNQFGASAGGPIQKNKTFIFGDYEGIRQAQSISQIDNVPSAAARTGNLSTGKVTVDPGAAKYLALYALPNVGVTTGDTGQFSFGQNHIVTENFIATRLDHTISSKDSIFGTFSWDKTPYTSPDSHDNVLLSNQTLTMRIAVEETHIFSPTLVNSFRAGYNRSSTDDTKSVSAINPAAADLSLDSVPGRAAAQLQVGGLTQMTGGMGGINTYLYRWNDYQVYDDAFKTIGTHSIKFGGDVEHIQDYILAPNNPNGVWSFGSLLDFLTNLPSKFRAGFPNTLSPRGIRQTVFGAYLQDDWRYHPNLTLNLGLRYEMATNITEVQGKLVNLPTPYSATPHLGNPLYPKNPTLRNFEPRVGFAWDPFRNGKTSIRGGFGMFDVLPLPYLANTKTVQVAPFAKQGSANTGLAGTFFTGAFPLLGATSFQSMYDPYGPRMYTMQWNMSIQRQLAPSLTIMLAYVGEKGTHIPFTADDGDDVIPVLTSAGYLFPNPVASGSTINGNFGDVSFSLPQANCFFDALEAQVTKNMSHGLQMQGSFTWGRSIDTNSASVAGDQFADGISSLQWWDQRLSRGLSDFAVPRTLTVNGVWDVPTPKSLSGPAAWLAKGWQLNGILTAEDGAPFTATFGTDGDPQGINNSDPWAFPNRLTGSGCSSLVNPGDVNGYIKTQCFVLPTAPSAAFWNANCDTTTPFFGSGVPEPFPYCFNLRGNSGRNIIGGPGIAEVDFSVFKNNYIPRISENFNVQFRAEFFNILNRANFALPVAPDNTDIFDSAGAPTGATGLLTSTSTSAREIQFAIKFIW